MLKAFFVILVLAIAAAAVYVATRPDTFGVERTIRIKASPENIFPLVNDFHQWALWSPWEKLDPAMQRNFSGAELGVGTIYEWQGNKKVGKGRMEILESNSPSSIKIKLDFIEPFEGHNQADFTFKSEGELTTVTWVMTGPNVLMGKIMSLFVNMDKLIGKDFEQGLVNLKSQAEKSAKQ